MTPAMSWGLIGLAWAVAIVGLWQWTVALDRRDRRRAARGQVGYCPSCRVRIYDHDVHRRLAHSARVRGPEDRADWR